MERIDSIEDQLGLKIEVACADSGKDNKSNIINNHCFYY